MLKHSFAVMAYHDSPYLTECLDSLKNQSAESRIYISTSTPSNFIQEIANRYEIEIFAAPPNQGIAADWNFALNHAKTKYVTLAHQDDLYLPDYTKECLAAAEKNNDTLICFTGYAEMLEEEIRTQTLLLNVKRFMLWSFMPMKKNIRSKIRKHFLLSTGCPIAAPSVMYNLETLKGFQFSTHFSINMDWDAWFRMSKMKGRFVFIEKVLLLHRIHSGSATTSGLQANVRQEEDLIMFRHFWPGWLARFFAKVYSKSYRSNETKQPFKPTT
jgi:glycosyltransferase involved in cell wall biosynthesis